MRHLQQRPGAPRYLIDDMVEDVLERLGFLRFKPNNAFIVGDWSGALASTLRTGGCSVIEASPEDGLSEEMPLPHSGFDLVVSLGTLDTLNDLPGALIHLHSALATGGLMLASFPGAGSLPFLRNAMLAAEIDRPAARLHPMVDVRAGGQLLQRAGFDRPVADSRTLIASFPSLAALIADIRAQGLGNVLADPGPAITRAGLARAKNCLLHQGDRFQETFEILTLTGWKN